MIFNAIVKKVPLDATHQRLEVYSPKYPNGQALAFLDSSYEGNPVKFITGWEDIMDKERPFTLNGGVIDDKLVGNTTLVRGFVLQCTKDNTLYIVMDPMLLA
jgi:hypothetical protein